MEKDEFLNCLITDLNYTASVAELLIARPKALREVLQDERVKRKLKEDPVFFAVLMCNDKWLVNAPDHQKLLRDQKPKQVAVCGRGWGKSLVFSRKNLWLLYTKPNIESLIISSTQRQSMIMFDYCYTTIKANPLLREMLQRPGTTRTIIKLKSPLNGKLIALPYSPDKIRGFHPDWVFLDEASIVPSEMITSEIMMMLTKPNAALIMSGTPMAFDHAFHRAFLDTKRYSIHHYSSDSSPLVSKNQLTEWREMMTKEEWEREVEAKWVESTQTFFPMDLILTCIDPELDNPTSPNRYIDEIENVSPEQLYGTYYAGLDVGKQVDHSVLAIVQIIELTKDKKEARLIHKRQFPLGTPYNNVVAYAARANQIFNFDGMYVDQTGVGDAIVDELKDNQITEVEGVFFTDVAKESLLNHLKLLMENKKLHIQGEDRQLIAQINEQQYEYLTRNTGEERIHLKFRHPRGRHDDQLFALALACYASKEAEPEQFLAVVPR